MSKWSFSPEHFPYVPLYFELVYVELGHHSSQNLGYIEEVFHSPKLVFCSFTTACVEVKICVGQKGKQYECQTK